MLAAMTHTKPTTGETRQEYAPSGAQKPLLIHVVPPSKTSTTAATPAANNLFEINPPRQNPNVPAMINMARGKELITKPAHAKSFRPDVIVEFPELAIE
jgi:hypothetical protein